MREVQRVAARRADRARRPRWRAPRVHPAAPVPIDHVCSFLHRSSKITAHKHRHAHAGKSERQSMRGGQTTGLDAPLRRYAGALRSAAAAAPAWEVRRVTLVHAIRARKQAFGLQPDLASGVHFESRNRKPRATTAHQIIILRRTAVLIAAGCGIDTDNGNSPSAGSIHADPVPTIKTFTKNDRPTPPGASSDGLFRLNTDIWLQHL